MTDRHLAIAGIVISVGSCGGAAWSAWVAQRAHSRTIEADRPRFALTHSTEVDGSRLKMKLRLTNIGRVPANRLVLKIWKCNDTSSCARLAENSDEPLAGEVAPGHSIEPAFMLSLEPAVHAEQPAFGWDMQSGFRFLTDAERQCLPPVVTKIPRKVEAMRSGGAAWFVLKLSYSDSERGEPFNNAFYVRWDGVVDGAWATDLHPVTASEQEGLERAISK